MTTADPIPGTGGRAGKHQASHAWLSDLKVSIKSLPLARNIGIFETNALGRLAYEVNSEDASHAAQVVLELVPECFVQFANVVK